MKFSQRAELVEKYNIWRTNCNKTLKEKGDIARIADVPLSVITFLDNKGYLSDRQRWIPVSERLPEESLNSVIGWDAYRERCVFVQYIDGYFQITGSDESFDIVAWMPVPEPYEAESDPWEKWLYPNRKENEK